MMEDVSEPAFRRVTAALARARNEDGGFGPIAGLPSEPEATALAAIATGDDAARAWLGARQGDDGSVVLRIGHVVNDAATSLAAIAFGPGPARERALDHVVATRAVRVPSSPEIPHDGSLQGWAWTEGQAGWVEPTSHALLALRMLRPDATAAIEDAVATLRDRETADGGWNAGNREAFGVGLWPYGQTTAIALVALHGVDAAVETRGLTALRRLWRQEEAPLTVATATAALRLHGDPDAERASGALGGLLDAGAFGDDAVAIAWAAIALHPTLGGLR